MSVASMSGGGIADLDPVVRRTIARGDMGETGRRRHVRSSTRVVFAGEDRSTRDAERATRWRSTMWRLRVEHHGEPLSPENATSVSPYGSRCRTIWTTGVDGLTQTAPVPVYISTLQILRSLIYQHSPVPVRSAVKSYFTSWILVHPEPGALNRLTELTSTTVLLLAFLDPRVGHTMYVLSPFISILCHSD